MADSSAARHPSFLAGGGEMGERMRAFDWSRTPLGPPERWPQSLRSALSILLPSKAQIVLFWGPDLITFYNDAYRPVFGAKHPHALGLPAREAWSEIWTNQLQPLLESVLNTGEAYWAQDLPFFLRRHGFLEETYFDVSYDPVRDESGNVGGIFCIVSEKTGRILGERRLQTLRDLSACTTGAKSTEEACEAAAAALAGSAADLPFTLFYLLEEDGRRARLEGVSGFDPPERLHSIAYDDPAAPWPLRATAVEVSDAAARLAEWPEAPERAVVLPVRWPGHARPAGFVVAGISPRLVLDETYKGFLDLLAGHVSSALANARAYEEEKKRAETLAELDRAKTAFFSNVSHEFRTPLTLMLGPVEDLLARGGPDLSPAAATQLDIVNRNGLRLLRLVNTLLDFSRIEAGRVRATYRATDLAALTAELASVFRSAVERAGLELRVDCPPLPEPVFVDRDMWEKIVLNLLSNAFKFTFEGRITVALRADAGRAVLEVRDTGTGIPEDEMPRLFERFHRVRNARGRTHEGSGIGLALVQELVKQHGGTIAASSEMSEGTTFTVTVPLGTAHLPADQLGETRDTGSTATGAAPYVEEALRWLPYDPAAESFPAEPPAARDKADDRPRVLVADDNADMRDYLVRMLAERYQVEAVADGEAALAALHQQPRDLVLTDVMMPRLDGFGLLKELRAHPATQDIPVIMLSARAGEESRVEGMEAGADDYLIKPFSARELLARVAAHLQMARLRREAGEALRDADRRKDEFLATLAHELRGPLAPIRNMLEIMKEAGDDRALIEQARSMMERQVSHLVRLVDDLIDVSRITSNKLDLHKETVELRTIVEHAVENCRPLAEKLEHEVSVTLPAEPVYVEADAVRLTQVFNNLVHNAYKYTEPRGQVWVTAERQGSDAVITVRDTGVGIPADRLSDVFEMFTQVEPTVDRSQGGLGIGLMLVKRLVEMHGGNVTATSPGPGRGSAFIVRLPIVTAGAPKRSSPEPGRRRASRSRRILVVEDNLDSAASLAMLLRIAGNEVQVAHDGLAAVTMTEQFRPEVVLLDIGLPKQDGFAAARSIREQAWGKSTILIALTGWGQENDRRHSKEAGFDWHMVKPVEIDALMNLLETPEDPPQRVVVGRNRH